MKGLSTTIILVVTVVVILVAALVVLTIFAQGIQTVATITQAQTMCSTEASISCPMGWPPTTWTTATKRIQATNELRSCDSLVDCKCANGQFSGCTNKP
jgi:predicted PurR-regulated permease PerM